MQIKVTPLHSGPIKTDLPAWARGDLTTELAVHLADRAAEILKKYVGPAVHDSLFVQDTVLLRSHHQAASNRQPVGDLYNQTTIGALLRRQRGTIELCRRIVLLEELRKLEAFQHHLAYIRTAAPSVAAPMSDYDKMSEAQRNGTRLLYEFIVASGIAINGDIQIGLANAKDTSQTNPDILCDFHIDGIACKACGTRNPITVMDRLLEGARQIGKSSARRGIVFINLTSCIDHEVLFPRDASEFGVYNDPKHAENAVQDALSNWGQEILGALSEDIYEQYAAQCNQRAFVLTAQTCLVVKHRLGNVPFGFSAFSLVGRGKRINADMEAAQSLAQWALG